MGSSRLEKSNGALDRAVHDYTPVNSVVNADPPPFKGVESAITDLRGRRRPARQDLHRKQLLSRVMAPLVTDEPM